MGLHIHLRHTINISTVKHFLENHINSIKSKEKVFGTILRRHPSASVLIAINDYYGNDVISTKGGERQKHSAAYVGGQMNEKCIPKKKHFPGIKEIHQFFSESTEQNLSTVFPEITFCAEMQTNK